MEALLDKTIPMQLGDENTAKKIAEKAILSIPSFNIPSSKAAIETAISNLSKIPSALSQIPQVPPQIPQPLQYVTPPTVAEPNKEKTSVIDPGPATAAALAAAATAAAAASAASKASADAYAVVAALKAQSGGMSRRKRTKGRKKSTRRKA